jgi:hypothetical protein
VAFVAVFLALALLLVAVMPAGGFATVLLLVVVALTLALALRNAGAAHHVDAHTYAAIHGLSTDADATRLIDNHLQRNAWYRRTGAWTAFLVVTAVSIARQSKGATFPLLPLPQILAGSLIGMALSEAYRLRDLAPADRVASLHVRTIDDYRPRAATWETAGLTVALLGAGAATAVLLSRRDLSGTSLVYLFIAFGAAASVFERILSAKIVVRSQPAHDESLRRVDDHLRATALESLRIATNGFLLCMILGVGAIGARAVTPLTITHNDETVRIYDAKQWQISLDGVEWTDSSDYTRVRRFADGAVGPSRVDDGNGRKLLLGVVGLVLFAWAFGCWRAASRIAGDPLVRPRVRPRVEVHV